jgi:hypothetical protein
MKQAQIPEPVSAVKRVSDKLMAAGSVREEKGSKRPLIGRGVARLRNNGRGGKGGARGKLKKERDWKERQNHEERKSERAKE